MLTLYIIFRRFAMHMHMNTLTYMKSGDGGGTSFDGFNVADVYLARAN